MQPITIQMANAASGIAALLLTSAFAIEAPADIVPPPANGAAPEAPKDEAVRERANDQVAKSFLGILATPIPDMVAEHLGLEAGQGVAVKTVAADGPAAMAGIQPNDIITRIADKPVGSHADVAEIIGEYKPGDSLRVDLIQKGKAKGLDVTLGIRPAGAAAPENEEVPLLENLPLEGIPQEMADRIRDNIKGNIGGMQLRFPKLRDGGFAPEDLDELRKDVDNMRGMKGLKGLFNVEGGFQSSVSFSDDKGRVEMKTNKDGKEITVRDPDGKVVWSGPWDTDQDKEAAPPEIRERIDSFNLDKANGFGGMLKIRPGMIHPKANPGEDENPDKAEEETDAPK